MTRLRTKVSSSKEGAQRADDVEGCNKRDQRSQDALMQEERDAFRAEAERLQKEKDAFRSAVMNMMKLVAW